MHHLSSLYWFIHNLKFLFFHLCEDLLRHLLNFVLTSFHNKLWVALNEDIMRLFCYVLTWRKSIWEVLYPGIDFKVFRVGWLALTIGRPRDVDFGWSTFDLYFRMNLTIWRGWFPFSFEQANWRLIEYCLIIIDFNG